MMFQTNVTGLINMTQAVLPIFQGRPDGGSGDIINVGSIAGKDPCPAGGTTSLIRWMTTGREAYAGGSIYCATKAAVRSFTDSLRRELVSTRIRVMEVDPGQVETVSAGLRAATCPRRGHAANCGLGVLRREVLRRQVQGRRGLRVSLAQVPLVSQSGADGVSC